MAQDHPPTLLPGALPVDPERYPSIVPTLDDLEARVRLRALGEVDVPRLVEMCQDATLLRQTTVPRPYGTLDAWTTLVGARTGWLQSSRWEWAVARPADLSSVLLGTVNLRVEAMGVYVGFAMHPDARGKGLVTLALQMACRHAFALGVGRIRWRAFTDNFASRKVAWKCGFTFHGTIPEDLRDGDGNLRDRWHASLGPKDEMGPRTPWMQAAPLKGTDLRLRPWRDDDRDACQPLADPPHFMPPDAAPTPLTFAGWLDARRERMASGNGIYWCVADAATDLTLGGAMVFSRPGPMVGPSAEIGYFLFPRARGRGITRAAVRLVTAHIFARPEDGGLGFTRLTAVTAPDNVRSNAVLTSCGFTTWGTEHAARPLPDGTIGDAVHWELVAPSP